MGSMVEVDYRALRLFGSAMRHAPKEVQKQIRKEFVAAGKKVKPIVRESARQTFPSGGGMDVWAARLTTRTVQRFGGRNPGITVIGRLGKKGVGEADVRSLNRGRVMHPVYGGYPLVGPQQVRPGFWTRPLEGPMADEIRSDMAQVMKDAAQKIADLS
jgi:hypothetical protein